MATKKIVTTKPAPTTRVAIYARQLEWNRKNPEKLREYQQRYREKHKAATNAARRKAFKERFKNDPKARQLWHRRHRLTRQGTTPEQFDALLAKQGGVCAICKGPSGKMGYALDHDHTCCTKMRACARCTRGILCANCNNGLGRFKDKPELLLAAAEYLRSFPLPESV